MADKLCIVSLVPDNFDNSILEEAFDELKLDVETIRLPFFYLSALTPARLNSIRNLLAEKAKDAFVVFFPNTVELFPPEADCTITFSAYRSWFEPKHMRVIPHPWTPVRLPEHVEELAWRGKPALRVGFMGRSHATSKLARLIQKAPDSVKEALTHGKHLQHLSLLARLCQLGFSVQNVNAFPRIETMQTLRAHHGRYPDVELEIVERLNFGGTENELDAYKRHLASNTYVICARGSENYSFRLYETLNYGRVPVIVDTDMVLPSEIDWKALSVIVPYHSLDKIYEAIVEDYRSRSAEGFLTRQKQAFAAMKQLGTMDWMKKLAASIGEQATKR